jgi:DNA-binding PadR family transcriptional regulator
MSPVFRHGGLRLYLLKLLDESPRHGYEVIRLLQDRFMGVYAPSPGTIYPRLARLEEEGLVTHDEADGRKVYRLTDKGREELHARLDDLNELEDEITASVRDIAREVSEDVRETVRTLREELTWAAREFHTKARQPDRDGEEQGQHQEHEGRDRGWQHERARAPGGHKEWGDWSQGDWASWTGWGGWPGGAGLQGCADAHAYRDLERLARQFSRELRAAAWQAQAISEDAVRDLRAILDDTIDRIRTDVFKVTAAQHPTGPGDDARPRPDADTPPTAAPE